jgi:hypothetical protein
MISTTIRCQQESHDFKSNIFKICIYFKKSTNKMNIYSKALCRENIVKLFKKFIKFKMVRKNIFYCYFLKF